jgi:hypothetical protein
MKVTYAGWPGSPPELREVYARYDAAIKANPFSRKTINGIYAKQFRQMYDYDRQTVWRLAIMLFESYGGVSFYSEDEIGFDVRYPSRIPPMLMRLLQKVFVPYKRRIGLRDMLDDPYFNLDVPFDRRR